MRRFDLAIVGGGTAGLVAAFGAAGLGARVVLCERRAETGGDCRWTGCIPSKSLLAAAEFAHRMRTADSVGLEPAEPTIDFARVMAHVHGARERIAPHDSIERLRREGVDVVRGSARFAGPGRLVVDGQELPELTVTADGIHWHPVGADLESSPDLLVAAGEVPLAEAKRAIVERFLELRQADGTLPPPYACAVGA